MAPGISVCVQYLICTDHLKIIKYIKSLLNSSLLHYDVQRAVCLFGVCAWFSLCIVTGAGGLIFPQGLLEKCLIRSPFWCVAQEQLFVFIVGMDGKMSLLVSRVSLLRLCLMLLPLLRLVWQEFTAERSQRSTLMIKSSGLLMLWPVLCNSWVCSQWVILAHVLTGIFNLCSISGMMQAEGGCLCLSQASFIPTVLALDVCLI